MRFEPDLLRMNDGTAVKTAAQMEQRRQELLALLEEHAYGAFPAAVPVRGTIVNESARACSGDARLCDIEIACDFGKESFVFPVKLFLPNTNGKKPLLVLINFSKDPYCEYVPVEEIVDNGFALAYLYYGDITADDGDFSNGAARFFPRTGSGRDPGKIGIWAWGVSRAVDYLVTLEWVDEKRLALIGHSRLGKTALWCAANDMRFQYVCSNDSGCMGAAYRGTWHAGGETVSSIARVFPYWFCENFQKYKEAPGTAPFDQHLLLACIAPRKLLVNSAALDAWADPVSEQYACVGASPAWEAYGKRGYLGSEKPYGTDEGCLQGDIAYYKRRGVHFLGRRDWLNFMAFIG